MTDDITYKYSQIDGRMSYTEMRNSDCEHTTSKKIHLGQLKLLIAEILFLAKYSKEGNKVLYVGAAMGYHTYILAKLFPYLTFDLWDPGKFKIKPHPNITIYNKFFRDEDALDYKKIGSNILFISDIRNLEIRNLNTPDMKDEQNQLIENDNRFQMDWVQIINPIAASIKFRLAYDDKTTSYLTGKIYLQPYSPLSTESRLFITDFKKVKIYDNQEFDEKLAYFNCNLRRKINFARWKEIMDKYNVKNIWDNAISLYVLQYYLHKVKKIEPTDEEIMTYFNKIIKYLLQYGHKYNYVYTKHDKYVEPKEIGDVEF